MKTGIIIQARLNSNRFPAKIIHKINDKRILDYVIDECCLVKNTETFLAVPNNQVANFEKLFYTYFNKIMIRGGSEQNVLNRYFTIANDFILDTIIRITGDCPLIKHEIIEDVLNFYNQHNFDYVSNFAIKNATTEADAHNHNTETLIPDGFSVECFSFEALKKAHENETGDYGKEHVSSWIKNNLFCGLYNKGFLHLNGKFSIDTTDDLEVINAYNLLYDKGYVKYNTHHDA